MPESNRIHGFLIDITVCMNQGIQRDEKEGTQELLRRHGGYQLIDDILSPRRVVWFGRFEILAQFLREMF
jgi:hypothetical protein